MFTAPARPEIDNLTLKLVVGLMALTLGPLTTLLAHAPLPSISESYWADRHARDTFVGFLFAIAAFLTSYNGQSRAQMLVSKMAAGAAMGIALFPCQRIDAVFPCQCAECPEQFPRLHDSCAAVMFLILTYFCYVFLQHARAKGHREARRRVAIYAASGLSILGAILVLGIDRLTNGSLSSRLPQLTFWGELIGLVAFGISWLTASRVLPIITRPDERHHPFR